MQYFTYQHVDGSHDVAPYNVRLYNNQLRDHWKDSSIMIARTQASVRGATPLEVQHTVESLA